MRVDNITEENARKLVARLHRLEGQVRALEKLVAGGDAVKTISQFEAVVAAAKASLLFYVDSQFLDQENLSPVERKTLKRLFRKLG